MIGMSQILIVSAAMTVGFGCSFHRLAYEADVAFKPAVAAESPEALVLVEGRPCLDVSGRPGLCSARFGGHDLEITIVPRPEAYRLTLYCSNSLVDLAQDVEGRKEHRVIVPKEAIARSHLAAFTCVGEIFPPSPSASISFEVRVRAVDPAYVPRESAYQNRSRCILGRHAALSLACSVNRCEGAVEAPEIEINETTRFCYSESASGRTNYLEVRSP